MAGRYDRNPFDEDDEVNPFAVSSLSLWETALFFVYLLRDELLCALRSEGGGRGKASGQSKFGGGPFYTTATGSVPPVTNSRLSPLPPEPADFYNPTAPVDIPLDSAALHIGFCIFAAVAPPVVFRGKSLTGILPAVDLIGDHVLVGVFYFIGFGLFCLESVLSIWVIQQVYMYFRGTGKAAEMKREAARGALRAAF
ncbi:UNVERIFIED_CONTAM: putative secretory carrier-associated membrane protein 1 [Sesamum angustifolium]|uniref:Secretory carrier-associated membrane protein n=1 Tax=Sesamum angustifolium TaxID=2727405 RepID=A0AAW2KUG6_9LAMI